MGIVKISDQLHEQLRLASAAMDRSINARPGNTVIVLWEGGFTVTKLYIRGQRIVLSAGNGFAPIIVPEDIELDVWGVVTWNLHSHL